MLLEKSLGVSNCSSYYSAAFICYVFLASLSLAISYVFLASLSLAISYIFLAISNFHGMSLVEHALDTAMSYIFSNFHSKVLAKHYVSKHSTFKIDSDLQVLQTNLVLQIAKHAAKLAQYLCLRIQKKEHNMYTNLSTGKLAIPLFSPMTT